jgi:transposase-like protein/IS1 family transposase
VILSFFSTPIEKGHNQELEISKAFCPNPQCPAKRQAGMGNIQIHSRKQRRYRCKECRKAFAETALMPFYRLRHSQELFVMVVTLLANGYPLQAIVAALSLDERTVSDWQKRAAKQSKQVHHHLVERERDLREVQCDELRVKIQGKILWVATAIWTQTRLFLGGEVSCQRDRYLITRLIQRVRLSALKLPLLIVTDGLRTYKTAISKVFREKRESFSRGRKRLEEWGEINYAQVIKRYKERRVVEVERRIVKGSQEMVESLRHKASEESVINTAFVEPLNATIRQRLSRFVCSKACFGTTS